MMESHWVIAFSLDYAYVVEADSWREVITKPHRTFGINYHSLKHKYMDIEVVAKDVFKRKRKVIDPRLLFKEGVTADELFSISEIQKKGFTKDCLERMIDIFQKIPDDLRESAIKAYDSVQTLSDGELYDTIRDELMEKRDAFSPKAVDNMSAERVRQLKFKRYLVGRIGFESMEGALDALDFAWANMWENKILTRAFRENKMKLEDVFSFRSYN